MSDKRKNNGGARPGAGRKPRSEPTQTITLRLPVPVLDKLERAASERGCSRTQILISLIEKL